MDRLPEEAKQMQTDPWMRTAHAGPCFLSPLEIICSYAGNSAPGGEQWPVPNFCARTALSQFLLGRSLALRPEAKLLVGLRLRFSNSEMGVVSAFPAQSAHPNFGAPIPLSVRVLELQATDANTD